MRSASPLYLLASVDDDTLKNVVPLSVATAFASSVFPVPGGPNMSTPLHGLRIPWKNCGIHTGKMAASCNRRLASSSPAMLSHLICGFVSKISRSNMSTRSCVMQCHGRNNANRKCATDFVDGCVGKLPLALAVLFFIVRLFHAHAPRLVLLFLRVPSAARNGRSITAHIAVSSNSGLYVHLRAAAGRGSGSTGGMHNGRARICSALARPAGKLLLSEKQYQHGETKHHEIGDLPGTRREWWVPHRCSGFASDALATRGAAAIGAGAACF